MTASGGSGLELVAAAEGWRGVSQELCKHQGIQIGTGNDKNH